MKKRLFALLCVAVMASAALPLSGCRRADDVKELDETKTQLYVGTLDQGVGKGWLQLVADRFEEAFADYELNGKTGVQVHVEGVDRATSLINNFKRERVEVVFNEGVDYETWVNKNLLLDITDAVSGKNADLSAYGDPEGTTIESKMDESAAEYYKTDDGKYYAIPFYEDTNGIMYNVDLWEKYGFYFKEGGGWTGDVKEATAGQDNKKGTFDDGLPRTFDDFFTLCEKIKSTNSTKGGQSLIPIAWNGKYDLSYINSFLFCMAADVDGAEQYSLNFTFNGEAEGLITGFNGTTPIISQTKEPITDKDGYKLYKQQGKYTRGDFGSIRDKDLRSALILDNPFGATSSKHILVPMFAIAKHFRVQMICLSDINKSDVINCFDIVIKAIVKKRPMSNNELLTHEGNESIEHGFYRSEQLALL